MSCSDDFDEIVAAEAGGFRFVPPRCYVCGLAHGLVRRFNGGSPITFYAPRCGCDDDSGDITIDWTDVDSGIANARAAVTVSVDAALDMPEDEWDPNMRGVEP